MNNASWKAKIFKFAKNYTAAVSPPKCNVWPPSRQKYNREMSLRVRYNFTYLFEKMHELNTRPASEARTEQCLTFFQAFRQAISAFLGPQIRRILGYLDYYLVWNRENEVLRCDASSANRQETFRRLKKNGSGRCSTSRAE